MRREIILFLMGVIVCLVTAAEGGVYSGGSGDLGTPYLIANADDIIEMSNTSSDWDRNFLMVADVNMINYTFTTAIIAPDLPDTTSDFDGIPFSGSFDGNWHTIHRLTITGSNHYLGLFGKIQTENLESTIIRNLLLTDSYISALYYAGSLVGCLDGGIVRNCFVYNGAVIARYRGGGLIGFNESGSLQNACFTGTVDSPDLISGHDIGGLVGKNAGMINQCFAIADLNVVFDAGGLVGCNEGVISNCYSSGILSGFRYVGGLVGYFTAGEVNRCFSAGSVTGDLAGGLIGYIWGDVTVTDSFWDTTTSGQDTSAGGIGLPTEDMQQMATFTDYGWDFVGEDVNGTNDIWRMCVDGIDYPHLSWEYSINGDFSCPDGVGTDDLISLSHNWLNSEELDPGFNYPCDPTFDGVTNLADYVVLAEHWLED